MTVMSKAAILHGMRDATARRKRHDAAAHARAAADSARARLDALAARLDALDTRVEAARADPLAAAAERERRRRPYRADMARFEAARRADLLAAIPDQHPEFEWSPSHAT